MDANVKKLGFGLLAATGIYFAVTHMSRRRKYTYCAEVKGGHEMATSFSKQQAKEWVARKKREHGAANVVGPYRCGR